MVRRVYSNTSTISTITYYSGRASNQQASERNRNLEIDNYGGDK